MRKNLKRIDGKTHSEILAMGNKKRHLWYKTLSPREKKESMSIVDVQRKQRQSEATRRNWQDPDYREKMVESNLRKWQDPDFRKRVSKEGWWTEDEDATIREHYPVSTAKQLMRLLPGRTYSAIKKKAHRIGLTKPFRRNWTPEEDMILRKHYPTSTTRQLMKLLSGRTYSMIKGRIKRIGLQTGLKKNPRSTGYKHTESYRQELSDASMRENNPNWKGGSSFEPYCPRFNGTKKEEIRNRDNRTCALCGKSEILNGRKLDVHHIDGDKVQGCNGVPWYLCALCRSCNPKKDTIEKEFIIVTNSVIRVSIVGTN